MNFVTLMAQGEDMASNYECSICGSGSNGNLPFCSSCGESGAIIYTGKHDREVERAGEQRRRQEEQARAQRLKQEESARKKQEKELKKRQKKSQRQQNEEFSPLFFFVALIAVGLSAHKPEEENAVFALILGCIAGVLAGKFYKVIIGIGVAIALIYLFGGTDKA